MSNQNNIDYNAKILWDYLKMQQKLELADCIVVLGNEDVRTARRAAEIFSQGYAPLLVVSGKRGELTQSWPATEAEVFKKEAIKHGVPKEKILTEEQSTNTGENIRFVMRLLEAHNLYLKKFILVTKPYMERRAYATFEKFLPGKEVVITSPDISYEDYPHATLSKEYMINILVGDMQRVKEYPVKGFQIYQEIPENVWQAYEELVKMGFTEHLIKS